MRKIILQKILGNLLDKLRKSYRNGTVVKKLFTFLKLQKILGNLYSSEQINILQKTVIWCPEKKLIIRYGGSLINR